MTFKKRPPILAFWLNDRKMPLVPRPMSVAEITGTLALLGAALGGLALLVL